MTGENIATVGASDPRTHVAVFDPGRDDDDDDDDEVTNAARCWFIGVPCKRGDVVLSLDTDCAGVTVGVVGAVFDVATGESDEMAAICAAIVDTDTDTAYGLSDREGG